MEYGNRWRQAGVALAAFAATAALVFLGNGLMPRWPLMWFAPLPVLLFALRRPAWQAGLAAGGAWLVGGLNLWSYLRVVGVPRMGWLSGFGTEAVVFAAGVLLTRALAKRGAVWTAWMALPALWAGFEYVSNLTTPNGSAGATAYSQLNFLPFLQTASLAGPWGMSFVMMLFPTGLALAIHLWSGKRGRALRVLGATLGIVGALLTFGAVRLAIPQRGPEVKVGLIASDANGGASVERPGAATEKLLEEYAAHARQLIAQGAQVVVMPEHLGVIPDSDVAQVDGIFQPIADQTGAVLVVGVARVGASGRHNQARIYAPDTAVRTYDKEHLLPPFETSRFTPGTKRLDFDAPGTASRPGAGETWGVAICKDMDFTRPAWSYGRAGVGLMLVPAWDFNVDGFWHGHIAVMRAVEDGFSLVRSARNGLLTVADDRGRIRAERASSAAPFAMLLAEVPAGHQGTLFQMLGDWFGWGALLLLALVLGRLWVVSRARSEVNAR